MEGILIPELVHTTASIQRPHCLSQYDGQWANQLSIQQGGQVPAQVLIGTDCAYLFPASVFDNDGNVIQTRNCRLKCSYLSGRYLLFGTSSPDDVLIKSQFPEVNHLGAASMEAQLAEYEASVPEDIVTI